MTTTKIHTGYVITNTGTILLQIPADNQWGFCLQDNDQTWPGGFGIGEWEVIAADDARITDADRERLGWILEEATQ